MVKYLCKALKIFKRRLLYGTVSVGNLLRCRLPGEVQVWDTRPAGKGTKDRSGFSQEGCGQPVFLSGTSRLCNSLVQLCQDYGENVKFEGSIHRREQNAPACILNLVKNVKKLNEADIDVIMLNKENILKNAENNKQEHKN